MAFCVALFLMLTPFVLPETVTSKESEIKAVFATFDQLYSRGVDAYLQNRWYDCVALIEKALEDYHLYHSLMLHCRLICHKDTQDSFGSSNQDSEEPELLFFEAVVKRAFCLTKCERTNLQNRPIPLATIVLDFQKKAPYNYLQLCYYKIQDTTKAASCAYTFLIHNPSHEVMRTNLRFYLDESDVDKKKIKYLEAQDYQELYLEACQLYTEKKYADVIKVMEKSLQEYLQAENNCRLLCEGPITNNHTLDFYTSVANHFTSVLRCKQNCPNKLSYMYGQKHENLFSSHYHYLQFSYYKINQMKEACQAVSSYLLLHPNDEVMSSNQAFYSKQNGIQPKWFSPRTEAALYKKRLNQETKLMKTIDNWFQFNKTLSESLNFPTPPPGSLPLPNSAAFSPALKDKGKKRKKLSEKEIESWFQKSGVAIYLDENELNGTLRAAFTDLTTETDCQKMLNLTKEGAVYGDGYNGKESPHTEFEMFEGLTIARAAMLSQRGVLDPELVNLFLNISERARQAVEIYFNLETELFFSYTHLVCRTAITNSPEERKDFSHPVHADNCILMNNGNCLKQTPAYTWRDYSSIVYLNEDFDGGEFIFAEDKTTAQAILKPKCGLTVAFSAGKENLHGVKAVKRGRRCVLAMWYTLNPNHKEKERDFAKKLVADLIAKRQLLRLTETSSYKESVLNHFAEALESTSAEEDEQHTHSEL